MEPSGSPEGPSAERTPEEELESFQTESGLMIELVAAEPMVQDPVVCTFDEDGRLWVVEMRSYMPDVDGEGEREPIGRVSVLEDKDEDGVMDRSTVYLDSLVMPRALAITSDGVLVVWEEALWITKDTNGDLVADSRTLVDSLYAGSKLPEHSPNGMWRGIDNWYYNAKSRFRYRLVNGVWKKDSTEFRGQWGISHDDAGRLYYNYNWSQLHADLVPPNYLSRNKNHTAITGIDYGLTLDRRVYPIRPTPAVNRGYIPGILDEEQRLKEFTAACSPLVYRGTALPREFYGNAFVCEPSGNLIKRNIVKSEDLHLAAQDPNPGKEFLASTDERFRPVHLAQGPDGALYVVDMYRGLIQHKAYVTPYLREQSLSRKLVQPIHRGRIWRIVPENWKTAGTVKLSQLQPEQLIGYLSHGDGWYRDIAQRLLVDRKDKIVLQPLTQLALKGENPIGRFHALWTLEGLGLLSPNLLFPLLTDVNPLVSSTALR
ncbi:MAG: dehydrogenase, partial [Cyclobacteriaceae bacterium]